MHLVLGQFCDAFDGGHDALALWVDMTAGAQALASGIEPAAIGAAQTDGPDDTAFYRLDLAAGESWEIVLPAEASDDLFIGVYDAEGALVKRAAPQPEMSSQFSFTAQSDGPFYLQVARLPAAASAVLSDLSPEQGFAFVREIESRDEKTLGTLDDLANYLQFKFGTGQFNLSDSGPLAKFGTLTYNVVGNIEDADGLDATGRSQVREAFEQLASVTGINFVETTEDFADINFQNTANGLWATQGTSRYEGADGAHGYYFNAGTINFDRNWEGGPPTTILHEILHVMGLSHLGPYNGGGNSHARNAVFANDSDQESIMSYWSQAVAPGGIPVYRR